MQQIKIFENPKPYNGSTEYLNVGTYGNHPIYVSKHTPRGWIALFGSGSLGEISINDEVFSLLRSNQHFENFLEAICEHEVRYGYGSHEHDVRTDREREVLKFLAEHGITGDF